jgi:formate dehydrogenase iron-sulfur subunit
MKLSRRTMLKLGAAAGATSLAGRPARAEAAARPADARAVLVDTTRCIGCRACEAACAEANNLAGPPGPGASDIFEARRTTGTRTFTVVNRVSASPERFVKTQCMHCVEPGCATACPARALEKTAAGPVVYHPERCLGCRYCMLSCPFDVPKYEYESPSPYVKKCEFCAERQAQGLEPACTSVCPTGALTFGTRAALLDEARRRIYQNPGQYVTQIYGEKEAGGTSWLYITDVPLERLGLPLGLPEMPYSALPQAALAAVPFVLTLWPPLLMALYTFSQRRSAAAAAGEDGEGRHA